MHQHVDHQQYRMCSPQNPSPRGHPSRGSRQRQQSVTNECKLYEGGLGCTRRKVVRRGVLSELLLYGPPTVDLARFRVTWQCTQRPPPHETLTHNPA